MVRNGMKKDIFLSQISNYEKSSSYRISSNQFVAQKKLIPKWNNFKVKSQKVECRHVVVLVCQKKTNAR